MSTGAASRPTQIKDMARVHISLHDKLYDDAENYRRTARFCKKAWNRCLGERQRRCTMDVDYESRSLNKMKKKNQKQLEEQGLHFVFILQ